MTRVTRFATQCVLFSVSALPGMLNAAAPPEPFQGIYLTSWSAGREASIEGVLQLAAAGRINTVVIDIKDASGYVAYDTHVPDVARYDAKRVLIRNIEELIKKLHRSGIYAIARMEIFQDPRLARALPAIAVHSRRKLSFPKPDLSTATLWRDNQDLPWIDPAAVEAWSYNAAIAKDALARGFDEANVDYVRFPSGGDLSDMYFPVWDGATPRHVVIRKFFAYLRRDLPDATLSADLFGLSTVNHDDLGVGQVIEDAYDYFDYVCPMVYPSLYAAGFLGFQNPAEHPYRVVNYSLRSARERLLAMKTRRKDVKLRPWLEAFSYKAVYTPEMVQAQIRAAKDALGSDYHGYTVWNPRNVYSEEIFAPLAGGPGSANPREARMSGGSSRW
jgi:hypothetical protein